MKRILFLAPYSIPVNNPEAICNAKLLKVLSEAGYIIDVISKNNNRAYAGDADHKLFTAYLNSVKIFNLDNKINLRTIVDHLRVLLKTGYVYKGAHWAIYAIKEAEKLLLRYKYDCIMSRSPASELVALYLSRKYKIRWIANWNDPYPEKRMPAPYGNGADGKLNYFENRLLKAVAREADIHTFPCERLRKYMLSFMKETHYDRTLVIPHVCIDGLFDPLSAYHDDKLRIVHSGNVSFPRDPEPFFKGLRMFLNEHPNASIEVNFIGKQDSFFQQLIMSNQLESVVHIVSPLEYIDNLAFIQRNDVALLIEAPGEEGIYLPTKVGDYMQCGRDIFAVSPLLGTLHDLYEKGDVKYFASCSSPEEIKVQLKRIYVQYLNQNRKYKSEGGISIDYSDENVLSQYKQII